MAKEKASMWLRIVEIIVGLIILVLGAYAVIYPGAALGLLIGFMSFGLLVLGAIEFTRVFASGISGWRRLLNLILSIIAVLLALAVLINPLIYGSLTLVYLLALGLIFVGFASIGRASPGAILIGIIAIVLGFVVLVYPPLGLGLAVALLAVALIIFGLEAIVSGILGRWV
jgi:uncharacterized membrane protein HdeD (DUF308 family)